LFGEFCSKVSSFDADQFGDIVFHVGHDLFLKGFGIKHLKKICVSALIAIYSYMDSKMMDSFVRSSNS